ncbi:Release factor glutamine methyltransferase [Enhydrobacter sp. AX1]|nr:peptide chain release factor N(5)-glutamine methyltransferase [Enhydrobacter sp. AX1]VXB13109.1 Release factor glutamine methyltransferase [Enhydrobacter sp. AX1]
MNNPVSSYTIQSLLAVPSRVEKHIRKQLLGEYLHVGQTYLITHDSEMVTAAIVTQYFAALEELIAGKPFAYVVGKQSFWQHEFLVNQHTLIPRPDTERLIEAVLNHHRNSLSKQMNILDLGTGSGCIAITLAEEFKNSCVSAVDKSLDTLKMAAQNAKRIGVSNIAFFEGSWYEPLVTAHGDESNKFDIIVSNPPYIDPNDPHLAGLTDEPISALIADNKGMSDICHIVKTAPQFLQPHGLLAIEHGHEQGEQVRDVFLSNGFGDVITVKDYGHNDRVTLGVLN